MKTKSIPKTELFDRILFLPNMNGIIRTKHFLEDKKLAMIVEGLSGK